MLEELFITSSLINGLQHPEYVLHIQEWFKWRLAYAGGQAFINQYLWKYTRREDNEDFKRRLICTYLPAFAKAAINDIKNSIFQRMTDISRSGGSDTYRVCMDGNKGGIDNEGTDMNTFIGQNVIPELLVMSKVGIFVDMPSQVTPYKTPIGGDNYEHPYIYSYRTEDIVNWKFRNLNNRKEFAAITLRDYQYTEDSQGMPIGAVRQVLRKMWIGNDGFVHVKFVGLGGEKGDTSINLGDEKILSIKRIPFVVLQISESLMHEAANYQIALMNIASSDLMYVLQSNFPFYTEQTDSKNLPSHLNAEQGDGTAQGTAPDKQREAKIGISQGRSYGKGLERPQFIAPPSEPLEISMKKQEQMKEEIRTLVNLSLSNIKPKMASAESKGMDERGLEAGLSYIGLELQRAEGLVAEFWAMYTNEECAQVRYPSKYMLKTDEERWAEAEKLESRLQSTPSITYKREIAKQIARIMLGGKIPDVQLLKIYDEINAATVIIVDMNTMEMLLTGGVIALKDAAKNYAIPEASVDQAADDHAERLARISAAQADGQTNGGAARGVSDSDGNPLGGGTEEKKKAKDQTTKDAPANSGRGDA